MDTTGLFLVIALVWGLLGVSMALVMGRRGHRPFMWLVLAIALGPLVLPLAAGARIGARPGLVERVRAGGRHPGRLDVLVGIDGSAEAEHALRTGLELFGPLLGRLTLATVIDLDTASGSRLVDEDRRARRALDRLADEHGLEPEIVVLSGRPAEVLRKHALETGDEVLVVGRRGRGATRLLLGSVASELARGGDVPVLIV